jgi:hypothetical protein
VSTDQPEEVNAVELELDALELLQVEVGLTGNCGYSCYDGSMRLEY